MWNVPVDHEMFNNINEAQWLWYFYNNFQDEEEKFIFERDMVEYSSSFIEPNAVKNIRDSRNKQESAKEKESSEEFIKTVDNIFENKDNGKLRQIQKIIDSGKKITGFDYKHWINFKTDE